MSGIPESDWKIIRQLQPLALERFCKRVLAEIGGVIADTEQGAHERYLTIFKLIKRRDRELATCFDNVRRSTATLQLASMQVRNLLTEEEVARFSSSTREEIGAMVAMRWRS